MESNFSSKKGKTLANKASHNTSPAWSIYGGSHAEVIDEPCHWEKFLEAEHIDEKDLDKYNEKVLTFVVKNYRTFFVPTKVLKFYEMDLD